MIELERIKNVCPKPLWKELRKIKWSIKSIPYRGNNLLDSKKTLFFCSCCGLQFRSFNTGNYLALPEQLDVKRYEHTKQNVICPFCRSLPRHRILALWWEQKEDWFKKSKVLYFAPDTCETIWMERENISYTSADLYRDADLKIDIQNTGLPDSSYDIIVCNHVLEHVDDFRLALKEVYRVLKPFGSFICSFPMDPNIDLVDEDKSIITDEERIRRFGQSDHKRVFGMKAGELLEEAGFEVEEIRGDDFPENILPVVGPADYDMNILFHCRKMGKR